MRDGDVVKEYQSTKSASRFIAQGTKARAYLIAEGEAATNRKVIAEVERVRTQGATLSEVDYIARMLSRTY